MTTALSMRTYASLRAELAALAQMCQRTTARCACGAGPACPHAGAELRALIDIAPETRRALEAFCRANPREAAGVRQMLQYRDTMLDILERDAEAHGPAAA
jgi:hypothetical protein